jgi:hypothetical protein
MDECESTFAELSIDERCVIEASFSARAVDFDFGQVRESRILGKSKAMTTERIATLTAEVTGWRGPNYVQE